MSLKSKLKLMVVFVAMATSAIAQSLQHPVIWTTPADKAAVLEKIQNYSWAQSIVTKAKNAVLSKVNTHISNPAAILNTIPALAADDNLSETAASSANSGHSKVLNYASYAAMVYYVTGEEKYAQFAADILWYYIENLSLRSPSNTAMGGSAFYDPRSGYAQFAIAYDFMVNYLKQSGTKVYKKSTGTKVAFDNTKAQKAVYNIAMNALHEHGGADTKYGKTVSNHPILRAPGVLFSILCVENDTERERMLNVFWNVGTKEQNSFKKTILPMFGEQGIWPESVSYSFMQNVTLVLNIVDRLKPEWNVLNNNMHILDGNFLFDNLRGPDRRFVSYGDSHRGIDKTSEIYRYTLNLATRKGYDDYVQKATVALRQGYDAEGGYDPIVPISTFGNFRAFDQLFWGINIPKVVSGEINFQKPTVVIKHAGVALQRNYVEESNEDYGLCGIIGGAHYVHSHCTGITMELYGAGYFMAANGGLPKTVALRQEPEHTGYFWRHAGSNTMIVNGTTHGVQTATLDGVRKTAWNSNSDLLMNTTVNVAAEPKHLEDPINPNFSFATQFLNDEINNDQQQRTLSTIRTSETSGYYFDMFRSKSLGTNNFHDYIYHNLGDAMHIFNSNDQEISVTATTRYQNDIGDTHDSPGWRFFENTKTTASIDAATKVRFDLNETNTYMNMFAPAGVAREYTKAIGPATRDAKGGYDNKKTQIIAIRQSGEAWNKPYVHIFEPSKSTNTSVKSVEHLYRGSVIVGAKVESQIGDKVVTDYVICQEDASKVFTLPEVNLNFTGRFAVVRQEHTTDKAFITLYIGEGTSLSFGQYSLQADASKKGQKVIEGEVDMSRVLGFKGLSNNQEIAKGTDLTIEAIVGSDFNSVTLWHGTTNLGTINGGPYTWSGHAVLKDMNDETYIFKLVAKDASNVEVERSITIKTFPNTIFSGAGQYKIYNPNKSKWLGYNIATDDALVTNTGDADINKFNIVANGDKFNIYTGDNQKILIINSASGNNAMLATPTTELLASGDALFSITETGDGTELYIIASGVLDGGLNVNLNVKSGGTDIGRGTSKISNYQWSFTRLAGVSTSATELKEDNVGIKVYPNPTSSIFNIVLEGVNSSSVGIYNMSGKLVYSEQTSDNSIQLSKGGVFIPGIYIIKVVDDKQNIYHQKLVIK